MTTAKFVQTDFTSQDSATYKASIDADIKVVSRTSAMYAPHAQATPNMTILVDAGSFMYNAAVVENAQQTTGTITAPSSHPRIDLVAISQTTGVITVITGTEAASPTAPALTSGYIPIAEIALTVGQASITNSSITDKRIGMGATAPIDPAAGTAGLRTLGTGAQQACAGNDSRLSNTRTPSDASVTGAKLLQAASAGTEIYLAKAPTQRTTTSGSYAKVKEALALTRGGSVTITFTGSGSGYAKVYKNGSAIGSEITLTLSETAYSADFTVAIGDVIQVYAKANSGNVIIKGLLVTANDPYCVREATGY